METDPLAAWLWHGLKSAGIPVICIHARHAHAALSMHLNKTDVNDAHGLAQIIRTGWYREVEVKSIDSHRLRLLLSSRAQRASMRTRLDNQIRGCLKTFGIILTPGRNGVFERMGAALHNLGPSVVPSLLEVWRSIAAQLNARYDAITRGARTLAACRRMMTIRKGPMRFNGGGRPLFVGLDTTRLGSQWRESWRWSCTVFGPMKPNFTERLSKRKRSW